MFPCRPPETGTKMGFRFWAPYNLVSAVIRSPKRFWAPYYIVLDIYSEPYSVGKLS